MNIAYLKEPVFGNWYLDAKLGDGSFGTVYRLKRSDFDKAYYSALKVIRLPRQPGELQSLRYELQDEKSVSEHYRDIVRHFASEIELMSQLKGNTHIVSYEDHAILPDEDGIGWTILIRMELLTPLTEYATQHILELPEVLRLGIELCEALELCEQHHIIHRDIKPENIFISADGYYKLGDFGIARELEQTMSGMSVKGTYNYMAPEVLLKQPYDYQADIYSLGVVLYRLLNRNRIPFWPPYPRPVTFADKEAAIQKRTAGEPIPPIEEIPAALNRILKKACAPDPANRYAHAADLRRDLTDFLEGREPTVSLFEDGEPTDEEKTAQRFDKTLKSKRPDDSARHDNPPGDVTADGEQKKRFLGRAGIITGAVAVLLVIALVCGTVLVKMTGRQGGSARINNAYTAFLREHYAKPMGKFTTKTVKEKVRGVFAVSVKDFNRDRSDDCLVACASLEGATVRRQLAYYQQEADGGDDPSSVKEAGLLTVFEEPYYMPDSPVDRDKNETTVYLAEKGGKTYIISESVTYSDGYRYECHVSLADSEMKEVANLYAVNRASAATDLLYCVQLPEKLKHTDNGSLDTAAIEDYREGSTVLFWSEQRDASPYAEIGEAVEAFFGCFGVKKSSLLSDRQDALPYVEQPDDTELIYHYSFDYSDDQNYINYSDGTDSDRLIDWNDIEVDADSSDTQDAELTATDEDFRDFMKMVSYGGDWGDPLERKDVYVMDFSDHEERTVHRAFRLIDGYAFGLYSFFFGKPEICDEEEYENLFGIDESGEGGAFKLDAEKADWIIENVLHTEIPHSNTPKTVEYEMNYLDYCYSDGYLYISTGMGDEMSREACYRFVDYKSSDGIYDITVNYDFYGKFENDIFDNPIGTYHFYASLNEDETHGRYWSVYRYTCKKDGFGNEKLLVYDAYRNAMDDYIYGGELYDYSEGYLIKMLSLCDINRDGIPELITYSNHEENKLFFTFDRETSSYVFLGEDHGWMAHTAYYVDRDTVGLYNRRVYPGGDGANVTIELFTLGGRQLDKKELFEGNIKNDNDEAWEYFEKQYPHAELLKIYGESNDENYTDYEALLKEAINEAYS